MPVVRFLSVVFIEFWRGVPLITVLFMASVMLPVFLPPGGQAPVMMQQTFGLKSAETGKFCTANSWPYPPGVKGAPGAEQADTKQNSELGLLSGTD